MRLSALKNTFFPIVIGIVLVLISCGNSNSTDSQSSQDLQIASKSETRTLQEPPMVGANQTERYLPLLKGKNIAIVANQTSVIFKGNILSKNPEHTHLVDSLLALGIQIKSVFAPEHGFRGMADAGELVSDGKDKKTGLPIYSLHGKHKKPSAEQLKGLDLVVFDIQDVGVRFYTYISTLHYVMEACAENNVPLLVLDRPNPNGSYIDGPTLKKAHSSFLGMHPIPLVHGMTIAEYAQMINGEGWLAEGKACKLTLIPVKNYTHDLNYHLPIRPSPNLPNDQAIALYPSLGLFEGTNINAGRGTEYQFQRYGAPFLDNQYYSFSYTPKPNFGSKSPKHDGMICYGEDLSKIKIEREMTLKYVMDAYNHALDKSKVFNSKNFTTHAGTEVLQKQIEQGLSEAEIKKSWQDDLTTFRKTRSNYLLYD